jgi:pyruvate,water dikinase
MTLLKSLVLLELYIHPELLHKNGAYRIINQFMIDFSKLFVRMQKLFMSNILWLKEVNLSNIEQVGGKNASLGEMIQHLAALDVLVPNGFATTADAYRDFLKNNQLTDKIADQLKTLDINNIIELQKTGAQIRQWILDAPFSERFINDITTAYLELSQSGEISVAVRSSATAEDLPDASFAGQQETFLNIQGLDQILISIKHVFASLFTDRAITYRSHHHFDHNKIALSAGVQRMVRSDLSCSGVMFSLDTESGFDQVVLITGSYGLGETVVQGAVNPDEFVLYKPNLQNKLPAVLSRHLGSKEIKMVYSSDEQHVVATIPVAPIDRARFILTDEDLTHLAKQAVIIAEHYQRPMDIEWAKDGNDNKIYIVQARPETVKSRDTSLTSARYQLAHAGLIKTEGRSIGQRIGSGTARIVLNLADMDRLQPGEVLVTDMTDPDWEPVMKRAAAIVTNRGGRTCHAAIIARELGIPAVVGCGNATQCIQEGEPITVSCAEGETGFIYAGLIDFSIHHDNIELNHELPVKIMLNVGNPERAFSFRSIPNNGVGLARLEFIIGQTIGIHPKALLNFDQLPADLQKTIANKTAGYNSPVDFYVNKLSEGIATLAAAFHPHRVIVRLSDFKSNEYAHLIGGALFEPEEENPMLGFRGAARYLSDEFSDCFVLECQALKYVREQMGFSNIEIMVPFVRTLNEAKKVTELLAQLGLRRGEHGLKLIMMCEVPSNAILAEQFLEYFDGFSIGSNDLTQLTLGVDRDSGIVAYAFDERDPAVKALLNQAISACKANNKYIGICGQGPSDHLDFANWLIQQGVDSISLNPDSVIHTVQHIALEDANTLTTLSRDPGFTSPPAQALIAETRFQDAL